MQTRPIVIGFASGILLLVVAAASFSAGLYLGQRGYVADLQYQSPGQGVQPQQPDAQAGPQPARNAVNPGPPGAPSWPPDLMGLFVSLTGDTIILEGPQRQINVPVNASTRYTDELGNPIDPAILQAGDTLAVFGRDMATLIMRLPPRPNAP